MPADETFLKRWRRRRAAYNGGLLTFFAVVAFYVGPNLILFGKPTWITPAYFVPTVERRCVPIVRAMKEFRRDHGRLPARGEELIPDYHPPDDPSVQYVAISVRDGKFEFWSEFHHVITYDFDPASEGWSVSGVYTRGRIPAPPVAIGPSTRPTTGAAQPQ
jgi:hypothetical protein